MGTNLDYRASILEVALKLAADGLWVWAFLPAANAGLAV